MRKMIDFNEYLLTKIYEDMELRVKKVELVLSPRLIKILKEINHQIAEDLLSKHIEGEREFKETFVDLGTVPGKVSYIQASKIPDLVEPELVHGPYNREVEEKPDETGKKDKMQKNWIGGYFDYIQTKKNPWISDTSHLIDLHDVQFKSKDHPVWSKFRAEVSMASFVNTIFPHKYINAIKRNVAAEQEKLSDVQSFQEMFTAAVESHAKTLKLVSGDDILHYYSNANYFKVAGTLGNSCMSDPEKNNFMKFYAKNPEKISMLVLFPEDVRNKIIGRAIVWKLDEPVGRIYMDRIYVANSSDEYLFIEYAKRQGWLYKSSQSYGWNYKIVDSKDDSKEFLPMKVILPQKKFTTYPYIDTLQYYNSSTGEASSDGNRIERGTGFRICTDTQGGSSEH